MFFHKELTKEKWQSLSFFEQMANVGAEIGRAENWKTRDRKLSESAVFRGLELLDLTIRDPKNTSKLKELCRLREIIADYFCFDNIYNSRSKDWDDYFYPFNYAARISK